MVEMGHGLWWQVKDKHVTDKIKQTQTKYRLLVHMCKPNRSVRLRSFLSMRLLYLPHILGTHFTFLWKRTCVILQYCWLSVELWTVRPHLTFTCLTQGKVWHMGKTQMMWQACGEVNCWSKRFVFVVSAEDKQDEFTIERVYSHGTGVQKSTCIDYVLCVCILR